MLDIIVYLSLGGIVLSVAEMMRILSTNELVPKEKRKSTVLLGLPWPKETIPPMNDSPIMENPDFEKKYAELQVDYDILAERLKLREEEDRKVQEEVKKTLKKDSKYSKLAEEVFKDDK